MVECTDCHKTYTSREGLRKHLKGERCKASFAIKYPAVLNQEEKTNIIIFGQNDDILEILSQKTSRKEALAFIRNCAHTGLEGDCLLLQSIL